MFSIKNFVLFILLLNFPFLLFSQSVRGLHKLEERLIEELEFINYPPEYEFGADIVNEDQHCLDVAIIGGGIAGLTASTALFMEGIYNLQVFDQNPSGLEGPWLTYARMPTLRSPKTELGPALNIPNLTFRAWYEAQYGEEEWKNLDLIPTALWMSYLIWYRDFLNIPVKNEWKLLSISFEEDHFELKFLVHDQIRFKKSHKVVLATGREGFGGINIPSFVNKLSKTYYAHSSEQIDFSKFKDCNIGVIGGGASAFDAAATALEKGANHVDLIIRKDAISTKNLLAAFHPQCFGVGYYFMDDDWRWEIMTQVLSQSTPPPLHAIERVKKFSNFCIRTNVQIKEAVSKGESVILDTSNQKLTYDFLILATGFNVNGKEQPELANFFEAILLWKDQNIHIDSSKKKFGLFPYLGRSFEFLEKNLSQAPFLKDIHCFNHVSVLSHGIICRDITGISLGAKRLAEGIAADFLARQKNYFLNFVNEIEQDFEIAELYPLFLSTKNLKDML